MRRKEPSNPYPYPSCGTRALARILASIQPIKCWQLLMDAGDGRQVVAGLLVAYHFPAPIRQANTEFS